MRWIKTTVPFSFRDADVRGYAEDSDGAWLIEFDKSMTMPFCLYRFLNDEAIRQYELVDTFHTEWGARQAAARMSLEVPA